MKLIVNWKDILLRAWSMKLMAFAVFIEAAQEIVPFLSDILPRWMVIVTLCAALAARLIKQKGLPDG